MGLGATYAVHLRLIGKLVVNFLLVMMECFSLGAFVLSQCTRLTDRETEGRTDGRTDGRTACSWLVRACIAAAPNKHVTHVLAAGLKTVTEEH